MLIHEMRKALQRVYSPLGVSNKWTDKVAKMPDKQVYAVYRSFQQRKLVS